MDRRSVPRCAHRLRDRLAIRCGSSSSAPGHRARSSRTSSARVPSTAGVLRRSPEQAPASDAKPRRRRPRRHLRRRHACPGTHRSLEDERSDPHGRARLEPELETYDIFQALWPVDVRIGGIRIKEEGLGFPLDANCARSTTRGNGILRSRTSGSAEGALVRPSRTERHLLTERWLRNQRSVCSPTAAVSPVSRVLRARSVAFRSPPALLPPPGAAARRAA